MGFESRVFCLVILGIAAAKFWTDVIATKTLLIQDKVRKILIIFGPNQFLSDYTKTKKSSSEKQR